MCCFSVGRPLGFFARLFNAPLAVAGTNIFARMVAPGVQALVYSMDLSSPTDVAMILPLPVAPGSGEDAVKFVNLDGHPAMFDELHALFAYAIEQALPKGGGLLRSAPTLAVKKVGSFIASYVPTPADFARLDPRFRMPAALFDAVPAYADYGFAVFQLKRGKVTVHPMALTFPSRNPGALFFPTVHVHDGTFHPTAHFEHCLYYQQPGGADLVGHGSPAKSYEGMVDVGQPIALRRMFDELPNADVWIPAAPVTSATATRT